MRVAVRAAAVLMMAVLMIMIMMLVMPPPPPPLLLQRSLMTMMIGGGDVVTSASQSRRMRGQKERGNCVMRPFKLFLCFVNQHTRGVKSLTYYTVSESFCQAFDRAL